MQLGMIGLGKMGLPMAHNGRERGIEVVVFSEKTEKITDLASDGIRGYARLEEFIAALVTPRVVWLMIPAGPPVDAMISRLLPLLAPGDILIDGGNSWYQDSQRRYAQLKQSGMHFLDAGTSGGTEGARHGACLMVGGTRRSTAGSSLSSQPSVAAVVAPEWAIPVPAILLKWSTTVSSTE